MQDGWNGPLIEMQDLEPNNGEEVSVSIVISRNILHSHSVEEGLPHFTRGIADESCTVASWRRSQKEPWVWQHPWFFPKEEKEKDRKSCTSSGSTNDHHSTVSTHVKIARGYKK